MDSVNKFLATFALLAVTLAAGIYIARNGPAIDFNQPASSTSDKPANVVESAPTKPKTVADSTQKAISTEAGFDSLFNGHDLSGWTGSTSEYSVENGSLVYGGPGKGNLYTIKEYANFRLRFDYKLTASADNGMGIRTPSTGDPGFVGIEIQLLDESAERFHDVAPWQSNGSLCGIVVAKQGFQKPVGEWNNEDIIARGTHMTVILNGQVIVDAEIFDGSTPTLDDKSHPGMGRTNGYIALMGDTPRVEFRNIRLRNLSDR